MKKTLILLTLIINLTIAEKSISGGTITFLDNPIINDNVSFSYSFTMLSNSAD